MASAGDFPTIQPGAPLPPETSSHFIQESRSRLGLPYNLSGVALPALWSRAVAGDLLAIYCAALPTPRHPG
eukprot:505812-Pyramimonas_sp.AAC.1